MNAPRGGKAIATAPLSETITTSDSLRELQVPRGRQEDGTKEFRSQLLPRYARRTRDVDAAILGSYLAGANSRRRGHIAVRAGRIRSDRVAPHRWPRPTRRISCQGVVGRGVRTSRLRLENAAAEDSMPRLQRGRASGTNWTGATCVVVVRPALSFSMSCSSWTAGTVPPGITSRPPALGWATSGAHPCSRAAVTMEMS